MEKKTRYFKLMDKRNYKMIIKTIGREEYTYVFGEAVWQKTWLLIIYFIEESNFYEKYEEITEEQAYEVIKETDILFHQLEAISEDMLKRLNIAIPETQTKDMEIRIIYLLYCISKVVKIDMDELKKQGFTNRMIDTLNVLIENGTMKNALQLEAIREDTWAMLVKSEDIYQNGQKNERDRIILEEKAEFEDMIRE